MLPGCQLLRLEEHPVLGWVLAEDSEYLEIREFLPKSKLVQFDRRKRYLIQVLDRFGVEACARPLVGNWLLAMLMRKRPRLPVEQGLVLSPCLGL